MSQILVQRRSLSHGQVQVQERKHIQSSPNLKRYRWLHMVLRVSLHQARIHPGLMRVLIQLKFYMRYHHHQLRVPNPQLKELRLLLLHMLHQSQTPHMSLKYLQLRFLQDNMWRRCNSFMIEIVLSLSNINHDVVLWERP